MSVPEDRAERARLALERVRARTERARAAVHGEGKRKPPPSKPSLPFEQHLAATVEATARYLDCSVSDVKALIEQGKIRAFGIGPRLMRVIVSSVLALKPAPPQTDPPAQSRLRTMSGACGACHRSCELCQKIVKRRIKTYKIGGELVASQWITEDEARQLLDGSTRDLYSLLHLSLLRDNGNQHHRFCYSDIAARRQRSLIARTSIAEERTVIFNHVASFVARRVEAHVIIDDWLREASLLPVVGAIRFGRRVVQSIPPERGWYVYLLCYPDGKPFYVGKGQNDRMYQHATEARKGIASYKCNTIRALWRKGQDVLYRVVFVTGDEAEAYAIEREEIARYGRQNLTNATDGGLSYEEVTRILGFDIDPEYLSGTNFIRWFRWHNRWTNSTDNDVRDGLSMWAYKRRMLLHALRNLAVSVNAQQAVQFIDTEADQLGWLDPVQIELLNAYERRHVKYTYESEISEWDELRYRLRREKPQRRTRRPRIADQLYLDGEVQP